MLRPSGRDGQAASVRVLEIGANTDEHLDLRVWLMLMTIHKLVRNEISRRFRDRFAVTLPRFDLMSQLRRSPNGLRMVEISKRLMVTNGNVTAITNQLEKERLVRRTVDSCNRSAFIIEMTPKGKKAFDAMAREHQGWLVDLLSGWTNAEKKAMLSLLGKNKAHLAKALNRSDR